MCSSDSRSGSSQLPTSTALLGNVPNVELLRCVDTSRLTRVAWAPAVRMRHVHGSWLNDLGLFTWGRA